MVKSQDVGELWHRKLGHLHHGALNIMQQISIGLPKGKLEQKNTCKGFILGKYAKSSFLDRDSKLEQPWSEFTQMFVDHSLQPPLLNKGTILFLLMIFLVDAGSTLCKRRIKPS